MVNHKEKKSVSFVFSHLSEEERIDEACELLAIGVLRLAQKRGLLESQTSKAETQEKEALHKSGCLKKENVKVETVL